MVGGALVFLVMRLIIGVVLEVVLRGVWAATPLAVAVLVETLLAMVLVAPEPAPPQGRLGETALAESSLLSGLNKSPDPTC